MVYSDYLYHNKKLYIIKNNTSNHLYGLEIINIPTFSFFFFLPYCLEFYIKLFI